MNKFKVREKQTLKDFLATSLNISKSKAKSIIDSKSVLVNNKRVWIANHILKSGDIVEIPSALIKENRTLQPDILYEDDYIIAVNKPPFIVSESHKSSVEEQLRKLKGKDIKAIHRLDKETSGVLLFAKDFSIFETFKKLWEEKRIKKIYYTVVHGRVNFNRTTIDFPVNGKKALSVVKTLKKNNLYSFLQVDLKTGRKHQIRIHMFKVGHPVVGDKEYGYKFINDPLEKSVSRHLLHAGKTEFVHPYTKRKVIINAPIFKDFKEFLRKADLA